MTKMVPADKTTMSSTGSLLRVLRVLVIAFLSRIVEFDVNDISFVRPCQNG